MSSPSTTTNSDDEQCRARWSSSHQHRKPVGTGSSPSPQMNSTSAPTALHTANILHENSTRKSAFLPYRPQATVLTNLQRGNTEATFCPVQISLSFHERAGQGEITIEQIRSEINSQKQKCGKCNDDSNSKIDFADKYGFTPLHWAAYYGQLAAVELLITFGANVNAEAPELITPLLLAACGGHHEVVRFLLEHGADVTHMDIIGNTALMYAVAGNYPHTCNELLSKNPDMTVSNENGDTAYSLAVENGAVLAQAVLEQYLSALLSL